MLALEAPQKEYVKDVLNGKYELSKSGVLVNKRTRMVRRGFLTKKGYIHDTFNIDGKEINKARHRLVFETFNGEIPNGLQVNHINEDKTDNRLENLNLMTPKENTNWGTGNKRRAKAQANNPKISKSVIQKSLDGKVIKIWPSAKEIQRKLGYAQPNISFCCKGGYFDNSRGKWHSYTQAYGYKWEYKEEE